MHQSCKYSTSTFIDVVCKEVWMVLFSKCNCNATFNIMKMPLKYSTDWYPRLFSSELPLSLNHLTKTVSQVIEVGCFSTREVSAYMSRLAVLNGRKMIYWTHSDAIHGVWTWWTAPIFIYTTYSGPYSEQYVILICSHGLTMHVLYEQYSQLYVRAMDKQHAREMD